MLLRIFPASTLSVLIFSVYFITAMNLATTVWFSFFGYFPAPLFWLPILVYLIMSRPQPYNSLWLAYLYLLLLTHTAAPPMALFLSLSALFALVVFFQKRFSTLSMVDFILVSIASTFVFPVIYWILSFFAETTPWLGFLDLIISFLLSLPVIPPILLLCRKTDANLHPQTKGNELVLDL